MDYPRDYNAAVDLVRPVTTDHPVQYPDHDQWRVVFRWTNTGPVNVDICDYH